MVGPAGTGKSRLVGHAVRDLEGVAWVRATTAASEVPLGAFAHLLPPTPPSANPIGWAAAALQVPTLVVDDAHLLDPVSAALVHHVVTQGRTRVLATVRGGEAVPDAVFALWKDGLVPRLDLDPLTREEAAAILEGALGSRIESTALRRLWQVSGGNALYLRELVLSGVLKDVGGLWLWHGSLSMTATLREIIEARLGVLAPDERAALEFLAYGEPLGADLLAGLTSTAAVERLEDRRLVTVQPEGGRLQARLAHPLYGELIRDRCGTLRARKALRALAEAVEGTGMRRREDVLRVAVWRLDSGSAGDPELLALACGQARAVRDLELAERLGRAAVEAGAGVPARIGLGRVLNYADRPEDAEEVFREAWTAEMGEGTRIECGISRAINIFWGLGRASEARAVLDETLTMLSTVEYRQGVRIFGASIDAFAGDLRRARAVVEEEARSVIEEAGQERARNRRVTFAGRRVAYAALPVEAILLASEGRPRECLPAVGRALELLDGENDRLPSLTSAAMEAAVIAAITLGDLETAESYAARAHRLYSEFGTWNRAIITFNSRRAQLLRLRGRPADAVGWCRDAAARLPARRSFNAGPCMGELAHAYALLGDVDAAEEALSHGRERALPLGPNVAFPLDQAQVWILAARGDVPGAIAAALGSVTLPCQEPFALHDVVRLGRGDLVADRLAGLGVDSPLVALFARHAAAREPHELQAVSAAFEDMGLILYAAEAAAQAADLFDAAGRTSSALAARSRTWTLARRCQGARTPALVKLAVPRLTPRQREIAQLAASGLTNREIAARLYVSVRTVANTLVAVYEKVGVSNRAALAELLNTLG